MAPSATAVDTGTDTGTTPASFLPLGSSPVSAQIAPETSQPATPLQPSTLPSPGAVPGAAGANPDAYNPLAAQPYTPPGEVPVTPLPQTQLGPDQPPNGAVNHAGAIAYGLDQVLRGFMRGRATAQAIQAINLQKTSSGLQKNLDMASQNLYALARSGADPASQPMQDAQNQVTSAWQAQMDFMKQHVAGEQVDKKTGQLKPQATPLLQRLTNGQDPAAQSLAVYQAAQRLGPPIMHQIAPFLTPQYQAYAKTQAQTAGLTNQNALAAQQTTAQMGAIQSEFNQLSSVPRDQLSPEKQDRLDQLGDFLGKQTTSAASKSELWRNIEANPNIPVDQKVRMRAQIFGTGQGSFTPTARLATAGSLGEQLDRVAAAHGITRAQLPPDVVDAYHQRWAYDQHVATSSTRTQLIDTEDPVTHQPTKTPVALPGGTAPGPRPGVPKGWDDPAEAAIPTDVTHPVAIAAGTQGYTRAINAGYTPSQAKTVAKVAANSAQRSLNVQTGTPIPTNEQRKQTPDETDAYKAEGNIGKQLDTAEKAAQLTNRAVGDTMLSTSLAHANVGGRLSNFDIQRFSNLGSARLRMEGSALKAIDGTMTDEQRNMILDYLRVSYQTAHTLAQHYRNRDPGFGQNVAPPGGAASTTTPAANDPLGIR
jgi:hypothetical protein